jgi:asparagine synthase (glutamine-hydrolysing)
LRDIEANHVPGDLLGAGVALGGSAIVIAKHARDGRAFHGFDVFGMIPAPGAGDPPKAHARYELIRSGRSPGIRGKRYYGYREDLYREVSDNLRRFGVPVNGDAVVLHQGLFEDTLWPERPVAFAHVDCDWYEPVKLCLDRIYPRLSSGGFVIIDDYFFYGGATDATDEFINACADIGVSGISPGGHLVLQRR